MKGVLVEDEAVTTAIRRCQAGDMGGLSVLLARYQRPAQHLALLLTGDHALAEDIVQDTFLQAYRAMGRFQVGRPFAPWLYRILTNIARHRHRCSSAGRDLDGYVSDRLAAARSRVQFGRDPQTPASAARAILARAASFTHCPGMIPVAGNVPHTP